MSAQLNLDIHGELIIDNFAGGGGASTGIELALGRRVDIAINHDPQAVAMHTANHSETQHYCESVWDIDPREVTQGRPVGLVWLSPDCKHFSKAKGGKPVEKKIRGLAWVALRWAATVKPRVIMLENVEEFTTWGPLIIDGEGNARPCPRRKGQTFRSFVRALERQGYRVEHRELRACDYGTPTIRKRLFLIARRDGRPIVWPEATHADPKKAKKQNLKPWRTAAECIDFSLPCPSIFERVRPLADATLRRIAKGIMRYVVNAAEPFIVPMTHHGADRRYGMGSPLPTVTAAHRGEMALVAPVLTDHANASSPRSNSAAELLRTICAQTKGGHHALIAPTMIQTGYGERVGQSPRALDLEKPIGTLVGASKHALVSAFIAKHYTGVVGAKLEDPMPTVTACDHNSIVAASLVHMGHGEQSANGTPRFSHGIRDVEQPLNTITASGAVAGLVTAQLVGCGGRAGQIRPRDAGEPIQTITAKVDTCLVTSHLQRDFGRSIGSGAQEPAPTVTAGGGGHMAEVRAFLTAYYGVDQDPRMEDPLHTITARDRFGLVMVAGQQYQISDIGLRMLAPRELYRAQGFPESYIIGDDPAQGLSLTKTAQVRMVGNSVCPPVAAALVRANLAELAIRRAA